jgi:hypothetical protein
MQLIHNLGLLTAAYLIFAAVLAIELAIAARIDKRSVKRGRAVARPW